MPFPTCGIPGIPDLMHHKYVVRDGRSVWTGSMNWTTDSWTLQENVVLTADESPELAAEYAQNFEELWTARDVDASGHQEPRPLEVAGRDTRAWFTPGHGPELSHRIAQAIGRARERVRIASPVITAGPVLGTLAEVSAERRVDLRGVVDRTQMEQVVYQWRTNGHSAWKIPILASVLAKADFKGKRSTQYSPETPHDFMHAKVTVADDTVFAGLVQPVALGRDERGERAWRSTTPSWPSGSPRSSTRSASATRLCPRLTVRGRHQEVTHLLRIVGDREQVEVVRRDVALAEHAVARPSRSARASSRCRRARPGTRRSSRSGSG